jgi:hypothetical protein
MSIESSTWASISRSLQATATLNDAVSERRFAMVNVRNDGKISDVVHQGKQLK